MKLKKVLPHDLLRNADELPKCVKTLRRAQLLLLISELGPTTNHHLTEFQYSLNVVRRLTREFTQNNLVFENHHLYRITSKGKRILNKIIQDPIMVDFVKVQEYLEIDMERPTVTKL